MSTQPKYSEKELMIKFINYTLKEDAFAEKIPDGASITFAMFDSADKSPNGLNVKVDFDEKTERFLIIS